MRLFVIGNGFDISHGLRSSYYDFKSYLNCKDQKVLKFLDCVFEKNPANINWATLEDSLGKIGQDEINSLRSQGKYLDNQWEKLIKVCKTDFASWAESMSHFDPTQLERKYSFDQDDLFLTFNYTLILENLYEISSERINHIHGMANDPDSIVFGHGVKPSKKNAPGRDCYDLRFLTYKNTKEIVGKNKDYFEKLKNSEIDAICVLGSSVSKVDWRYFRKIKNVCPHAEWILSYYTEDGEEDREKIQKLQAVIDECFHVPEGNHFGAGFLTTRKIMELMTMKQL